VTKFCRKRQKSAAPRASLNIDSPSWQKLNTVIWLDICDGMFIAYLKLIGSVFFVVQKSAPFKVKTFQICTFWRIK
jgi:hypothetical protein